MHASGKKEGWQRSKGVLFLALAAGVAAVAGPITALAQEGKLSVHASPPVLYSGQSANVDVLAHFAAPGGAYAFASSAFDIYASDPMWTFASAGAIVGNDVLGASATQLHWPHLGVYANPSNPITIWHGTFTPQSDEPALIEIEANPTNFSIYPSELTSSSVACDAEGGSAYILANPLRVGKRWLAAPGAGTSIQIQDDVVIDGHIIPAENPSSIKIATFQCPSDSRPAKAGSRPTRTTGRGAFGIRLDEPRAAGDSQPVESFSFNWEKIKSSSTRVEFDQLPDSFTTSVQIPGAGDDVFQWDPGDGSDTVGPDDRGSRIGSMTVRFDRLPEPVDATAQAFDDGFTSEPHLGPMKVKLPNALVSNYAVSSVDNGTSIQLSDGLTVSTKYVGYLGGVPVASGELNGNLQIANALVVSSLPDTIGVHLLYQDTAIPGGADESLAGGMRWTLGYDQPVTATILGPNGNSSTKTLDRIVVTMKWDDGVQGSLCLGAHVFEAEGVQQMRVTPNRAE